MKRFAIITTLASAILFCNSVSYGQDDEKQDESVTIVYPARSGSIRGLSRPLAEFLGGRAEIGEFPELNTMILRVPKSREKEVLDLLNRLDAVQPTIRVRIFLLRSTNSLSEQSLQQLSGPAKSVSAHIEALCNEGDAVVDSQIELETLENAQAFIQSGHLEVSSPPDSDHRTRGSGREHMEFGTKVQVVARSTTAGIVMNLGFEKSQRARGNAQRIETLEHQSTLRIPAGHCQLVGLAAEDSEQGSNHAYLVVAAEVLEQPTGRTLIRELRGGPVSRKAR